MDWANERYVRLYVRDTKTWILLGWEGQALFSMLLRKADRAGVIEDVRNAEDISVILQNGFPVDSIAKGLQRLIDKSVVEVNRVGFVILNYIEAQEAKQSDAQRARAHRERRRDLSRYETAASQNVTDESQDVTQPSHSVTARHSASLRTVPSRTVPSRTVEEPRTRGTSYTKEFDEFRNQYPGHRRGGKQQDWKSWQVAKRAGMTPEGAGEYLRYWLDSKHWEDGYIVAVSKWLRDGYWETKPIDEPQNGNTTTDRTGRPHVKPEPYEPPVLEHPEDTASPEEIQDMIKNSLRSFRPIQQQEEDA